MMERISSANNEGNLYLKLICKKNKDMNWQVHLEFDPNILKKTIGSNGIEVVVDLQRVLLSIKFSHNISSSENFSSLVLK